MHGETNGIVLSLEMDQESSGIAFLHACVYEGCESTGLRFVLLHSLCYILYSILTKGVYRQRASIGRRRLWAEGVYRQRASIDRGRL